MAEITPWLNSLLQYPAGDGPRTIDGKYLSFARRPQTWDQLTDQQYQELSLALRQQPWREALAGVIRKHWGHYLAEYNTSPERTTFISQLLPADSDRTVLDIGCSFGNISQALAGRYQRVVAVDTPDNIVRWIHALKEKEQLTTLECLGIENLDFSPLPFKSGSFDLVVLAMTLQWIGAFDLSRSPDAVQRTVLGEIHRILKPGGMLVLFDVQRYKYGYFLGEADGSGLPYATLLPRRLADLYAKIAKRSLARRTDLYKYVRDVSLKSEQYRNYKQTYWYLGEFLRRIGFRVSAAYLPIPGPKFQKVFIPLADRREAERLFGQGYLRTIMRKIKGHPLAKIFFWLAIKLGFSRFLADGYLVIAEKKSGLS